MAYYIHMYEASVYKGTLVTYLAPTQNAIRREL